MCVGGAAAASAAAPISEQIGRLSSKLPVLTRSYCFTLYFSYVLIATFAPVALCTASLTCGLGFSFDSFVLFLVLVLIRL